MDIIKTQSMKEFHVNWIGVDSFVGFLRIAIPSVTINEAYKVFSDESETNVIEHQKGEKIVETFSGYTNLQSISIREGVVTIVLKKGE